MLVGLRGAVKSEKHIITSVFTDTRSTVRNAGEANSRTKRSVQRRAGWTARSYS